MATSVSVGDKVTTNADYDYSGVHLAPFVKNRVYDVIEVGGGRLPEDRIVIGINGVVTAAVKLETLNVVQHAGGDVPDTPIKPSEQQQVDPIKDTPESKMTSEGIESYLTNMLYQSSKDYLKYSMRLFGIPHQFTDYCDYRAFTNLANSERTSKVGRKFIENIYMEAPIVTIMPGKPSYLPAAKNKRGITNQLLKESDSPNLKNIYLALDGEKATDKLRYYDFKNDYIRYMQYVNILCATAASYMGIEDYELDGVKLKNYEWQNYRYNADDYKYSFQNIASSTSSALTGIVNGLKTYGTNFIDSVTGNAKGNTSTTGTVYEDKYDKDILDELEDIMTQTNFVQFYVSEDSSFSDNHGNEATTSKLEGIFQSGQELYKEIAFVANSGGIDPTKITDTASGALDAVNEKLLGTFNGSLSGMMQRLLSAGSNIISGETMIFPKIYMGSNFSKSYSLSVDLRAPYGNKLSYFINVLVPLFHILGLAVPKQTTANTYGSPFLVKFYYPGVATCNLGLVSSISIDKGVTGDSWTVDGYPSQIKVTMEIEDLYSDLSLSPAGDVTLFLSNSSLLEYIATACGVNLTVPQLKKRITAVATSISQAFDAVDDTIAMGVFGSVEKLVESFVGI